MDYHAKKFLEMLEEITKDSYENPQKMKYQLGILDLAEAELMLNNVNIPFVLTTLRKSVISNHMESVKKTEFDIHNWFERNYEKLLGGNYTLAKKKNDNKHIPDFWLANNDEFIPVEVKLNEFDKKALLQLKRYMSFYGCERGVAVAKRLSYELPNNITFIAYNQSEVKK